MKFNKMEWLAAIRATVALKTEVKWTNQAGKVETKKFNMTHAAVAYDLAEQYATWGTGEGIWVSKATLADQWGASRTGTIIPTFNMLEALGFIKEDPSKAKGESRYYDLTMPKAMPDNSAINEKIAERQAKRAEEKRNQRAEQKVALAAFRAQKGEEASESPVETLPVQNDPELVTEPQTATQAVVEPLEDDADEDVFADYEPEGYEKPADKPAKKTIVAERLEEMRAAKDADQETAERILEESDDPEEARKLFSDENWMTGTMDPVQRAAAAAFKVEKVLETVSAPKTKTITDSFDEEW